MVIAIPLVAMADALVAILLIAAAALLGGLLGALFARLPWPLSGIANAVFKPWVDIVQAQVRWSQESAHAFAQALGALFINPWYAIKDQEAAVSHTIWAVARVRWQAIPNALNTAVAYADGWGNLLKVWIVSYYGYAVAHADQVGLRAMQYADGWGALLKDWIVSYAGYAEAYALGLFRQAEADAAAGAVQAEGYAQALQRQAVGYAQQLYGQAIGHADQVGVDAEGYAQALQRLALGYAEQIGAQAIARADADLVQAQDYARALAVPIAAAVTAIEDSPCMRACGPLGEIGQLIQDLEGAGLLALLLGLVAEARTHPDQVTTMMRDVFVGPLHDVVGSVVG